MMKPDCTRRGRAVFAVLAVLGLGSCEPKTDEARCDEMADYLEGRESLLSRRCTMDTDCAVVFVRPDRPMATSSDPADVALARVLATYQDECEPIPQAEGRLTAVCLIREIDVPDPDNIGGTIMEPLDPSCVLRGTYEVPEVDAGLDVAEVGEPDAEPCLCTSASDCVAGETCWRCACVASTLCGGACIGADRCDALDSLGLGADVTTCVAGCEDAVMREPETYARFATCLSESACDQVVACSTIVP